MEQFKSPVSVFLMGRPDQVPELATEDRSKTISINWMIDLDMRNYGIKSFDVVIPDQDIELPVVDLETNEESVVQIKLSQVVFGKPESFESSIYPKQLVYLKTKNQWILQF
jgi:hypothetical protein